MKRFLTVALLGTLGSMAWAGQEDLKKAEAKLAGSPDDPAANLAVGRLRLAGGDPDGAVPFLLKGSEASLKAAAKAEGVTEGSKGLIALEAADLWAQAAGKNKTLRQPCLDRASWWYAKAWPDLDVFYRTKLRERLAKLYAPVQPARGGGLALAGWGGVDGAASKIEVVSQRVHSGGAALRYTPKDKTKGTITSSKPIAVTPGKKIEVVAWVLSDETDGLTDSLKFVVRDNKNGFAWTCGEAIKPDLPAWVCIKGETTLPEGSLSVEVQITVNSKQGAVFVDDISIKQDGVELMKVGNFE